mmetsp:Transcript_15672/g.35149  ORF Transcript_15672/g.35149 Transcript_15672/m.35149 type:complete len:108 (+) Transcript_15672:1775-2098(+)
MWSQTGLFDVFDMANNIAYYAEGSDVYAGYIWKWADGNGDTIDRVYTGEESDDLKVQAMLIRQGEGDDRAPGKGKGRRGGRADVHVWVRTRGQHVRTGLVIGTLKYC